MKKILPKLLQSIFIALSVFVINLFPYPPIPQEGVYAQSGPDYQCIGKAVAEYMNTVIRLAGNLQHIKLLSPAFNMTSVYTRQIIEAMNAAGANWGGLDGIAGNAYNCCGNKITEHVENTLNYIPVKLPVMLTKTGKIDGTYQELGEEMNKIKNDQGVDYIGALFFNVFNTNPGRSQFAISDDDLPTACSGSCSGLGANSATYYPENSSFYDRTASHSMSFTLSISNADSSTTEGVLMAHARGLTPIIRVGTTTSSGPSAEDYANYLISLDSQVNNTVYAIAGPNEPDSEYWASPGCAGTPPQGYIPCNQTTENEWHSLRPYRGSPCNLQATDLALFCGNDFIVMDSFSFTKNYNYGQTISWGYQYQSTPNTSEPIDPFPRESPPVACGYCNEKRECVKRPQPCDENLGCKTSQDCLTPSLSPCYSNNDGTEKCYFNVARSKNISIDLENTYFPIMGLTESPYVVNRETDIDKVDDPQKVNEYVSWYLNGVFGRAEYPPEADRLPQQKTYKSIPDFSGPLKKLLSFESQIVTRINEIKKSLDDLRHDQIVGCFVSDLFQGNLPISCKDPRFGKQKARIEDWDSNGQFFPPLRRDFDTLKNYLDALWVWRHNTDHAWKLFRYIPFSSTEDRLGKAEISTYSVQPPITSEGVILYNELKNQKPADLFFAHMQETEELGKLFQKIFSSADLIKRGVINEPADPQVVPYRPFCDLVEIRSNPGDDLLAGEITATLVYDAQTSCKFHYPYPTPGAPEGNVCTNVVDKNATCQSVPDNYDCEKYYGVIDCNQQDPNRACAVNCRPLPVSEDCAGLNKTCFPNDWSSCEGVQDKIFKCPPGLICENQTCYPGDTCGEEECIPGTNCASQYCPKGANCYVNPCPSGYTCANICTRPIDPANSTESCPIQLPIALKTTTYTPLADEVWARLVAGPAAVFRRVFPQIRNEPGRPIKALKDIPGASPVDYITSEGVALAGNPVTGRLGGDAELYFPHIGGIHEYFLRCIQKTLRPKDYGEGCVDASSAPLPPGGPPPSGECSIGTDLCKPETLAEISSKVDGQGWQGCKAVQASIICNRESGGDADDENLGCTEGLSLDYSIGLFQINLLAHCEGAFEYGEDPKPWCEIKDQTLVGQCWERFKNPTQNIQYAYILSQGGEDWSPWGAYDACKTVIDSQCPSP